ncbi:hypothetical protein ABZZ16_26020 [Streptomyces sp. NPDC006386]|uniref:hypothetical protein n=1 Tax=Streptomyces sp. NPDC006386 TaxID=3156762 RepID=UPI0033B8E08E
MIWDLNDTVGCRLDEKEYVGVNLKRIAVMAVAPVVWLAMTVTPASAESTWSRSSSAGYAEGIITNTGDVVSGYVEDIKADGLCVQIEIRWYDSSGNVRDTDWSDVACPKGDKEWFSKRAGDDPYFNPANRKIILNTL